MKISIQTYGNTVTVDHESHVVDKNLTQMFPGVAAIHYDHERGIGHVEYLPTPSHTFYGMDGLKGLSDVLAGWDHECKECERINAERLDKANPGPDADEDTVRGYEELKAKIGKGVTPDDVTTQRQRDADDARRSEERAPVVLEDF